MLYADDVRSQIKKDKNIDLTMDRSFNFNETPNQAILNILTKIWLNKKPLFVTNVVRRPFNQYYLCYLLANNPTGIYANKKMKKIGMMIV